MITLLSNKTFAGIFFPSALDTLLRYLQTQTLILTGIAGNFLRSFHRK